MSDTPTSRSLKLLRKEGWLVAIVEKWNPHVKVRQDLWGFGDLLACHGNTVVIVQTTTGSNFSARFEKIRGLLTAQLWLRSPMRTIELHAWRKVGPRGKRKVWECRRVQVTLDDLNDPQPLKDLGQ